MLYYRFDCIKTRDRVYLPIYTGIVVFDVYNTYYFYGPFKYRTSGYWLKSIRLAATRGPRNIKRVPTYPAIESAGISFFCLFLSTWNFFFSFFVLLGGGSRMVGYLSSVMYGGYWIIS